jgi:hypothetical protein
VCLIAALQAYGFADVDVMDTSITNKPLAGWCQAACQPFK